MDMDRQKEKEKLILNRQKNYQRKDKFMLKKNFHYNIMSFCQENYGLILPLVLLVYRFMTQTVTNSAYDQ